MLGSYDLDIFNSEKDKWSTEKWKEFFQDRLSKMKSVRPDEEFTKYEVQTTAVSFYDNEWMLQVNVPLEKTLWEIYMWKTKGKVKFDILPDGQTDIEQLQPARYAMEFFMDGNHKENFWKENKLMREYKHKYWEWLFFTWIRSLKENIYAPKKWAEFQNWSDLLDKSKFEKNEKETWFFFPKALHPKDFWIDDRANNQPDVQYADDCIYKERVTALELKMRYWDNTAFKNIDKVNYRKDPEPTSPNAWTVDNREIILYHYFHRITKNYLIVANEDEVLYDWLYLYEDGKLPFTGIQHYSAVDRFRGEGIPERIAYLKAYKSEVFQDILTGSAMSSWINLLTWNDSQVWQDWNMWNRQVNIWRNSWDVDQVKQINSSPNLWYFTTVMDLIDREVTINSWINPAEQFEQTSDKVWIVEIQEANKMVRNASVDENYEIWLDDALTMMFSRIHQFAPSLLKEEIMSDDWKEVLKIVFPKITIKDYTVEKKKGQQVFVENIWKFWYFELKPEIVQWVWVKIVTPSTNSILPILERQRVTDYINNLFKLAETAAIDQSWESMKKLNQWMRYDEILQWVWDAYDYDINGLKANTEKDEIAEENIKKLNDMKDILTLNQWLDAKETVDPVAAWKKIATWKWWVEGGIKIWEEEIPTGL